MFQKGKPRAAGAGRKKGTRNKVPSLLKDAILRAAELAGLRLDGDPEGEDGLTTYLSIQATTNPGPFMALLGKVLPLTLAGDPDNPVRSLARIEFLVVDPKSEEQGADSSSPMRDPPDDPPLP